MAISGPQRVVAGAVLVVLLASGLVVWAALREQPTPPTRTTTAAPVAVVAPSARQVGVVRAVGSLAVLRDWDRSRAAAWAAGDPAALRRLYVPGSRAGRNDVAMLRAWTGRGLRVERMSMQVLAVELRQRTDRRLVLVVTDRLVGAIAVGARGQTGETALPRDRPTTRRLEFRRVGGRWLLASAQEVADPRPVASTDATSGSAKE